MSLPLAFAHLFTLEKSQESRGGLEACKMEVLGTKVVVMVILAAVSFALG